MRDDDVLELAKQESAEFGQERIVTDWAKLLLKVSKEEKDSFLIKLLDGEKGVAISLKKRLKALSSSNTKADFSQNITFAQSNWDALLDAERNRWISNRCIAIYLQRFDLARYE